MQFYNTPTSHPGIKPSSKTNRKIPKKSLHFDFLIFFQVGLNDSGEYRCGSDLTGETQVRVNVVAAETEQELKSLHLDSDSISSSVSRPEIHFVTIFVLVIVSFQSQLTWPTFQDFNYLFIYLCAEIADRDFTDVEKVQIC